MNIRKLLWVLLGITGGLLLSWLFPLKLLSRLAARFGQSAPCPASLGWLVNNPIRRCPVGLSEKDVIRAVGVERWI